MAAALDAILAAEPSFTAEGFLPGARAAYEMIVVAFAAGDLALRRLLTPDALANFATAIQARKAAEQTMKDDARFDRRGRPRGRTGRGRGGDARSPVRSKIVSATLTAPAPSSRDRSLDDGAGAVERRRNDFGREPDCERRNRPRDPCVHEVAASIETSVVFIVCWAALRA